MGDALLNINDWNWNKWTRLEVTQCGSNDDKTVIPIKAGLKGKLRACYEGNDENWKSFEFEFAEVNHDNHTLAWMGSVGPCGFLFHGYHVMRLEKIEGKGRKMTTQLIHTLASSAVALAAFSASSPPM